MSEHRGELSCPGCGGLNARLEDWATYVSVVCPYCGHKHGELTEGGKGTVTAPLERRSPCPSCGRTYSRRTDGELRQHRCLPRTLPCPHGNISRVTCDACSLMPRWNCVDYPDSKGKAGGMHYVPAGACVWCGKSREQIMSEHAWAMATWVSTPREGVN